MHGAPTPTASLPGATSAGGLTAFIDQGSEFEGKLCFKDTVRIDGIFRGEISSENTLIVGETGQIDATISSTVVVISGAVTGDIHASQQIVLHKTARVDGDLQAPSVVMEEGALFNGKLSMKKSGQAAGANLKSIKGGDGAGRSGESAAPRSAPAQTKNS